MAEDAGLEARPDPVTAVPGVYLAGDWVGSEGWLATRAWRAPSAPRTPRWKRTLRGHGLTTMPPVVTAWVAKSV